MSEVQIDTVKVRIYIEGVLFPFAKRVTIREFEGGVDAQIDVPPSIALRSEEWAGASCHIFYANARVMRQFGDQTGVDVPPGNGWPILFQGELSADQHQRSVQSESAVLNFVSHGRHFDQTQLYFYDPLTKSTNAAIAARSQASFIGNTVINLDTNGILARENQVLATMVRRMSELQDTTDGRNIAFTSVALEIMKSARDQHVLFARFDNRYKLRSRFAAYTDPDVRNILQLTQLKNLVDQRISKLPPYVSLKQVLELITNVMQYNWNHLAQPKLRTGITEGSEPNPSDIIDKLDKAVRLILKNARNQPSSIKTGIGTIEIDNPESYWGTGGTNVLISTLVSEIYSVVADTRVAGQAISDEEILAVLQSFVSDGKRPVATTAGVKEEVDLSSIIASAAEALGNGDKQEPKVAESLAADQDTARYQDELNEFVITPSMKFSHPPRCNVFFPKSFGTFGMNRSYFREITRLYAQVQLSPAQAGNNEGLIEWYIAPQSQAYHLLTDDTLSNFTDQYNKFMQRNTIVEGDVEDE